MDEDCAGLEVRRLAIDAAAGVSGKFAAQFTGRREDPRLLKGEGRYTADWNFPDQLYGVFLRSDHAHARIASMDTEAARAMPGVVRIFTGADVAYIKTTPPQVKYPGRGGVHLKVPERPILARDRVRYVGQEVALVVASSPAAALDAAEAIQVDYEDLRVTVDGAHALQDGAPLLHETVPGNLAFDYDYGNEAATAEAFAKAAHITNLTLDSTRVSANPMEPKACVAKYDATSETYDVYASSQGLSLMVPNFAAVFGIPAEKIRLHAKDVGGGFGVRSQAYPEYCAVMHAAKALGKPVKWVGSRFETIVSDHHGRAAQLTGELALDRDGRFIGLRHTWICNVGAYLSQAGPLINTLNPSTHSINVYGIRALYGRHRLALTNTTPITAYRGAGRPNVTYLVERLVDEAAREMGIDRVEIRRRNFIPKDAYPYKTPVGSTYDSGNPAGYLDDALRYSDWAGYGARRDASQRKGMLRGIGCAVFVEPSGGAAGITEQAAIKFGESGDPSLYVLSGPSGQGHETVFPELVAEELGIPAEAITLRASDPLGPKLTGAGTIGSRSTMAHGSALVATARVVVKKGLELAAKAMEVAPADVEFKNGTYRVKGTDLSISFQEVAKRYKSELDSLDGVPGPMSYPGGAHIAEVEIDPDTGEIEIANYVAVDDCGRVINHTLLEGQTFGGIVQGVGQVLVEHCVYDENGQILTGSFMDYAMPKADLIKGAKLYDHLVPSPTNLLGAKGAGEAGTTGAIPALANAVIDALRPLGIHHLDFPYSPS
ncbi:MAG TPA: xanthine dehydrogenase family protein molybdopterin-binding subunit, partial [Burkholderiales bacterium]|nr:xanthine dehydrogenase family protein molybdopterin-binding subunit [Burkholderiales bacterium]